VVCANSYDLATNMYLFLAPYFANWYVCLFPSMFVCAFTLYIVVGCVRLFSISTIDVNIVLSAWCYGGKGILFVC
jgi:hypothetical protein